MIYHWENIWREWFKTTIFARDNRNVIKEQITSYQRKLGPQEKNYLVCDVFITVISSHLSKVKKSCVYLEI